MSLTPQKIWQAGQHARTLAHHSSRQSSPAQVISCAICVRPWPDSGLPRVVFPSGPGELEGRLPSLLVHPASLPIPPLWVTQRPALLGSTHGQLSTGQTDDIAHPQHIAAGLPSCLDAEGKLLYRVIDHRQGEGASPVQSSRQILCPRYIPSSYSIASDQVVVRHVFFGLVLFASIRFGSALEFSHACSRGAVISLLTVPNDRPTNHTASSTLDL